MKPNKTLSKTMKPKATKSGKGKQAPAAPTPAKKVGKKAPAAMTHKVDDVVIFTGYTDLAEDDEELFNKGQPVRITEVLDGKYKAEAIQLVEGEDELTSDTVYESEARVPKGKEQKAIAAALAESDDDSDEDDDDEDEEDDDSDDEDEDEEEEEEESDEDEEEEESDEDDEEESDDEDEDEEDSEEDEDEDAPEAATAKKGKGAPVKKAPAKTETADKKGKGKAAKTEKSKGKVVALTESAKATLSQFDGDAVEAAIALEKRVDESYFDFGGLLSYINATGAYTLLLDKKKKPIYSKGKAGFRQFLNDTFQTDYRVAMYLIDIFTSFVALGKGANDFAKLGWSKAKELTKHVTEKNVDKLLEYAKKHTRDELVDYIEEKVKVRDPAETGKPGKTREKGETVKIAVRRFKLHEDQAGLLDECISTARGKLPDGATDEQCLSLIITEWAEIQGVAVLKKVKKGKEEAPAAPTKKGKAKVEEPEEEEESDEGDTHFAELGALVDAGGKKAKAAEKELRAAAEEHDMEDPDEFEGNWEEFGESLDNLLADTEDSDDEDDDDSDEDA